MNQCSPPCLTACDVTRSQCAIFFTNQSDNHHVKGHRQYTWYYHRMIQYHVIFTSSSSGVKWKGRIVNTKIRHWYNRHVKHPNQWIPNKYDPNTILKQYLRRHLYGIKRITLCNLHVRITMIWLVMARDFLWTLMITTDVSSAPRSPLLTWIYFNPTMCK